MGSARRCTQSPAEACQARPAAPARRSARPAAAVRRKAAAPAAGPVAAGKRGAPARARTPDPPAAPRLSDRRVRFAQSAPDVLVLDHCERDRRAQVVLCCGVEHARDCPARGANVSSYARCPSCCGPNLDWAPPAQDEGGDEQELA
eukprot:TRINITY_DN48030_c0_g1_i1.p2 TRINITY_DN48030_c0_g1~~TRINITY_DN48030_c0_g1_i1.p2  ORF type:complete len:146 (+),score=40.01 TRINITY_DN48030_c0_g1_i1:92-529(+)